MTKATAQDLYDTLSYKVWKSGLEMIQELKDSGKKVSGYFNANKYIYLSEWEMEGLIRSRERALSEERLRIRRRIPQREYLRISTGIPVKLQERMGGLEESLVKV